MLAARAKPECNDRIDNDGDGKKDLADAGCSNKHDIDESNCGDAVCEGGETPSSCSADCGVPDSCSDSDGGVVISVLGTASGYLNNVPYNNADYCANSDAVIEFSCSDVYQQSQQLSCGTDSYGSNYCANASVYRDLTDYSCAGGVCSSSTIPEFVESCPFGCSAGVCNPQPDTCADSDGGIIASVFGTVSGYLGQVPYTSDDYCVNSDDLVEWYCMAGQALNQQQSCGNDTYSGSYCSGNIIVKDFTDYSCGSGACGSSLTPEVQEDCDAQDGYGAPYCVGDMRKIDFIDGSCSGGACNTSSSPVVEENCNLADAVGQNYCYNGSVIRDRTNGYCSSGNCLNNTYQELVEVCTYGCTGGVCDSIPDSCSDTDADNIFTKGTVSGVMNSSQYSQDDFCLDGVTVAEWACYGTTPDYFPGGCYASNQTNLTGICINGRCT